MSLINRICPNCGKEFFFYKRKDKKEQITCSVGCYNSQYRTRENNPNYLGTNYQQICFDYHEKKCVICGEQKIVTVHHYDENNKNNSPENLVPLCPTHHQYVHSIYCLEVITQIKEYLDNWKLRNVTA